MALNQVQNYSIWHQAGSDKAEIRLLLDTGSFTTISNLPLASANFIVDLLRHEKPIYWDSVARLVYTSSWEPVGEGE